MTRLILAMLLSLAMPGAAFAHEYRFSSPDVLNLSAPERLGQSSKLSPAPGGALAADQAQRILAGASLNSDAPGQIPYSGEEGEQLRARERALISAEHGSVQRSKKLLSIKPTAGEMVTFRDWTQAGGSASDGDSETFVYMGRIAASGYHLVEVLFGQDSPGAFLVNPATGKLAFVHNGSDVVALSRDGRKILAFDPANAPFLLVIADLGPDGPTVDLQCGAAGAGTVSAADFKGWADGNAFGVVFSVAPAEGKTIHEVPVLFEPGEQGWRWSTTDTAFFDGAGGYACRR